jgi:hypothetical protein
VYARHASLDALPLITKKVLCVVSIQYITLHYLKSISYPMSMTVSSVMAYGVVVLRELFSIMLKCDQQVLLHC